MKKKMLWFLALLMIAACCAGAGAEGMVSIVQLREAAEAMGGRWRQTFETERGEVVIDVPIFVPDAETMPVLTLEGAKIAEAQFDQIRQGKRPKNANKNGLEYELERDGEVVEFFLGYEENGLKGYEAMDALWIQHGAYRTSQEDFSMYSSLPKTYHFRDTLDPDAPCLRGRAITLNDALRLWREDIRMCFPEDEFEIQPTEVTLTGSLLSDKTGKAKEYRYGGHLEVKAEQLIGGVPLIGGIVDAFGSSRFDDRHDPSWEKYSITRIENMRKPYGVGNASVHDGYTMWGNFATEEDYLTRHKFARTRSVEIADVPLASLDTVLAALARKIEEGVIRELHDVRLGYVLYSNPDMTDHAWAIPRWVIKSVYVPKGHDKAYQQAVRSNEKDNDEPWSMRYFSETLMDAQSGELIFYGVGDEEAIFSVPKMKTWDDVQ